MFVDSVIPATAPKSPFVPSADHLSSLELEDLDREIGELAASIASATCRWLLLVAEFDRRGAHEQSGFANCAAWLKWRCAISERAAYENLRVARALGDLPAITEAFSGGLLSYSKVRALTRVAEPESERELLELAREGTAGQLERILTGYRHAISGEEAEAARERRHFSTRWDPDGTLRIAGNLPPEEGALLLKALDATMDRLKQERCADALADRMPRGPEAENEVVAKVPPPSKADGLVALAELSLSVADDAERSGGDRNQVVVHVDLDDLRSGGANARNGSLEQRVAVSPHTVRRLACDASVVSIVERDGEPISVGRKTRAIPPSIARALRARGGRCQFPGCDARHRLDAHHVKHWADGGETSLSNLISLCRHHHRLIHEGGYSVDMRDGSPRFSGPSGAAIPRAAPATSGSVKWCRQVARSFGGHGINPDSISAGSRGEAFDLDLTVFTLASRRE